MVLKQIEDKITVSPIDQSWGPESGSIDGSTLQLFDLDGTFRDGEIIWSNDATWTRVSEDVHSPTADVSGIWTDPWKNNSHISFVQSGVIVIALSKDGSWEPDHGHVTGSTVSIFGLSAQFREGRLEWSNSNVWERLPDQQLTLIDSVYADPWQGNQLAVLAESGEWLVALSVDRSWGPDYGTLRGSSIELYDQTAELVDGQVRWSNGNIWPRVRADSLEETNVSDLDGVYIDPWQGDSRHVIVSTASTVTARCLDGQWDPEHGSRQGNTIELWGQSAKFLAGRIEWSNGNVWPRISE